MVSDQRSLSSSSRADVSRGDGSVFRIHDLAANYGSLSVFRDVSFKVAEGEIVGLIGPNGAGKTTLLNVVSGVMPSVSGDVWLRGTNITGMPAYRRARLGLARTYQTPLLFESLSCVENVLVAGAGRTTGGKFEYRALFERVGFDVDPSVLASSLPHGKKRTLELARALSTEPVCILMDEPASGLDSDGIRELVSVLEQMTLDGVSILLVEHNLALVRAICDFVVALAGGGIMMSGQPATVLDDDRVRSAYMGGDLKDQT